MKQAATLLLIYLFLARNVQAQGITIPAGAYVIVNEGNLGTSLNLKNNGTLIHNNGNIVCFGHADTIMGTNPVAFHNLVVTTGSTSTVITAGQTIRRSILCNGTLHADDNITLLSTPTQTAFINGAGTGEVLGNVTMQRYLPAAFGYKYLSSPFQSATTGELADEIDLNAAFPRLYRYEENVNSTGWFFQTDPAVPLLPLHGYAANFGASGMPATADITGQVNNGPVSYPMLENNNQVYTKGFNLLGNPYPSPIDWDAAAGWTRTNIDNAIYYFNAGTTDQYTGTYSSYVNGVSSDGIAGSIIPAMQGFFVHVNDGGYPVSGALTVNNLARTTTLNATFHKSTGITFPYLRLTARFHTDTLPDPFVLYFTQDGGRRFNKQLDALKKMNTDLHVPNLYSIAQEHEQLSIAAIQQPQVNDSITIIPLGIETTRDDYIVFDAPEINDIPAELHIYLLDAHTTTLYNLRTRAAYRAMVPAGRHDARFSIVFSSKEQNAHVLSTRGLNAFAGNGNIRVSLNQFTGEKGQLVAYNTLGQTMSKWELNGYGYHEIPVNFSNGIYIITFYSDKGTFSKKLFIGDQ